MDEYRAQIDAAVDRTVDYLGSAEALNSVNRDPYWPKWDSPWWRMTLLWKWAWRRVPAAIVQRIVAALNNHYLHHFPPGQTSRPARTHTAISCLRPRNDVPGALGLRRRHGPQCPWAAEWFMYSFPTAG